MLAAHHLTRSSAARRNTPDATGSTTSAPYEQNWCCSGICGMLERWSTKQKFMRDVDPNGSLSTKGRLTRPGPRVLVIGGDVLLAAESFSKFTQNPGNKWGGRGFFFHICRMRFPWDWNRCRCDCITKTGVDFGSQRKLPLLHNRSLLTHKLGYLP